MGPPRAPIRGLGPDPLLHCPLPASVSGMPKHKAKQSRPHVQRQQSLGDNGQLPSRPQSAQMLAGSSSGSFPLAGAASREASPLPQASAPCPTSPLSCPWLVGALISLERGSARELRDKMGGRREKIRIFADFLICARPGGSMPSLGPSPRRGTRGRVPGGPSRPCSPLRG